ncbi:MAG: N-acetylmuramoyl-L-alanine amidase CwlD [Clostridium perfringens]|uniref:N-acetylmuramoyl-L-alanine amidase CwlD n=1 Tax=Clostridium perfringens TaxID=1502 RepID=A0AAW4J547_CLOPF|nr:N-acetylmuramoyl-L-alanine amidase CwlD [Clostridium perfringens]EHP47064.1 N-acetylmuramoyl-L-alanine amidase CwlD [Clostridium perfringens WAL-14572]MBO3356557.1 N-acetylmuramoyl-L-alanine amidase CwlD [Clostridium perfringens]MBO3359818.1 N-acetylmuramoyl-L-alanine amidase CwlD [Clostridium perfringens]MCX0365927.1 N-acetylmuramoyl-L-alanine amidase CwlD [Clostridium perfringens]MDU1257761.1 N-acetylmuramoyl-L-alanine amidase CwlD [Clostridium perfringens]
MKKIMKIVAIMMLSFLVLNISLLRVNAEENNKVIVIDPGHGGIDGGAKSENGVIEKDINLSISLKTKAALESKGYKVIMTRSEDVGLYTEGKKVREKKIEDLGNRVKIKKENKCDAFISIHQNMFPQKNCKGAQVWSANNEPSQKLGKIIQQKFKEEVDQNNKREAKVAKKEYKILNDGYEGASVIVECGFLSNPEECELLGKEDYQNKIANTLANAIDEYFK